MFTLTIGFTRRLTAFLRMYTLNVPFFYRSSYKLVNILRKKSKDRKLVICLDHFKRLSVVVDKLLSISLCIIIVSDRKESFLWLDPAREHHLH